MALPFCYALIASTTLGGATLPSMPGFRIAKPPVIDGVIDDGSEWQSVPSSADTFDTLNGRGHNASHSVALMIGKGFKGSVVGGILPGGHAADIDPATGAAADGGELSASQSLASVAKTLGAGIGLTDTQLNDQITSGTAIRSVLA